MRRDIVSAVEAGQALQEAAEPDRIPQLERYFQAYPGGYGDGDRFRGVRVPAVRLVARWCGGMPMKEVRRLVASPLHEDRLLGAILFVSRFDGARNARERYRIRSAFLSDREGINNWDIVDASAPGVLGGATLAEGPSLLYSLASSPVLWDRRCAMVATLTHIRCDVHDTALSVAERLLDDEHDLIRKAVGWMLREVWKREPDATERFLERHAPRLAGTTLRYATEKMDGDSKAELLRRMR